MSSVSEKNGSDPFDGDFMASQAGALGDDETIEQLRAAYSSSKKEENVIPPEGGEKDKTAELLKLILEKAFVVNVSSKFPVGIEIRGLKPKFGEHDFTDFDLVKTGVSMNVFYTSRLGKFLEGVRKKFEEDVIEVGRGRERKRENVPVEGRVRVAIELVTPDVLYGALAQPQSGSLIPGDLVDKYLRGVSYLPVIRITQPQLPNGLIESWERAHFSVPFEIFLVFKPGDFADTIKALFPEFPDDMTFQGLMDFLIAQKDVIAPLFAGLIKPLMDGQVLREYDRNNPPTGEDAKKVVLAQPTQVVFSLGLNGSPYNNGSEFVIDLPSEDI